MSHGRRDARLLAVGTLPTSWKGCIVVYPRGSASISLRRRNFWRRNTMRTKSNLTITACSRRSVYKRWRQCRPDRGVVGSAGRTATLEDSERLRGARDEQCRRSGSPELPSTLRKADVKRCYQCNGHLGLISHKPAQSTLLKAVLKQI